MVTITLALGALLIALGLGAYLGGTGRSATALIPAAFGAVFVMLGLVGRRESLRRHAMHAAAAFALLALLGTARGLTRLPALLGGESVARPLAVVVQSVTALLCIGFLSLAIRSFVHARRARRGAPDA